MEEGIEKNTTKTSPKKEKQEDVSKFIGKKLEFAYSTKNQQKNWTVTFSSHVIKKEFTIHIPFDQFEELVNTINNFLIKNGIDSYITQKKQK